MMYGEAFNPWCYTPGEWTGTETTNLDAIKRLNSLLRRQLCKKYRKKSNKKPTNNDKYELITTEAQPWNGQ